MAMQTQGPFAGRRILVVDDEAGTLDACTQILGKQGYRVESAPTAQEGLARLAARSFDLAITDLRMPKMDGLEFLRAVKRIDPGLAVVMITGYASVETAVASMKEGAVDYIPKPFTPDELRLVVRKALERQELVEENTELRERLSVRGRDPAMIGDGEGMAQVRQLIDRVAAGDVTVLILGETGTGKELVARAIHDKSRRATRPLLTVNCAAIPSELLESELFGHEKGAFTGATRRRRGCFELADGGCLFLDEVGAMPLELQAKVLRAVQEREITPLGAERGRVVDVRIVAATNRDLKEAVRRGEFREDLFYRLSVVPIHLPPLRERREDIPALVGHFLGRANRKLDKRIRGVSEEAMVLLQAYDWPGNVRELENAVERATLLEDGEVLGPQGFRHLVAEGEGRRPPQRAMDGESAPGSLPTLEKVERDYILEVLQATRWNRKKASEILGISTVTIWRRIQGRD